MGHAGGGRIRRSARRVGNVCDSTCREQVPESHNALFDLEQCRMRYLILCGCQPSTRRWCKGRTGARAAGGADGPRDPIHERANSIMSDMGDSRIRPGRCGRGGTSDVAPVVLVAGTGVRREVGSLGWTRGGRRGGPVRGVGLIPLLADSQRSSLRPVKSINVRSYHPIGSMPVVVRNRPGWTRGRYR
jgi:hypothetical protein